MKFPMELWYNRYLEESVCWMLLIYERLGARKSTLPVLHSAQCAIEVDDLVTNLSQHRASERKSVKHPTTRAKAILGPQIVNGP